MVYKLVLTKSLLETFFLVFTKKFYIDWYKLKRFVRTRKCRKLYSEVKFPLKWTDNFSEILGEPI